jgi:hypothetical protein
LQFHYLLLAEGGLLIIGVHDNKRPLGLDGDYSAIKGDRNMPSANPVPSGTAPFVV